MIHDFENWSSPRAETNPFSDLNGAVLAIEASFYLERLLTFSPLKEPLLSALGGLPFSLKAHIENEIETLRTAQIKPIFIFNGMDVGKKDNPFQASNDAATRTLDAWDLYRQEQAPQAVEAFGNSGYAIPEDYYRLLQSVLRELNIEFQVAPYSAWGQLAYFAKSGQEYVDAIAASSELLMFDVDQVITKLDFNNSLFTFVKRQHCIAELGSTVSADAFVDACMLSGSSMLPTLPSLLASRKTPKIRQAFDLINMNGQSGYSACVRFQDDPVVIKLGYIDRYRRKRLAVKHQVYIASSGKVEPFGVDDVPNDLHDVIGQRLPDELYYYLSQGMIGPRVLNQLTTAHIYETCPIDGGESEAYHALVRDKLTPIRETTLSLLASSLSRAYQHREVKISCWFDPEREVSMRLTEVASTKASIKSWNVREDIFKAQDILYTHPASLSAALNSLKDTSFAEKTITPKGKGSIDTLETKAEILVNTSWCFLHLRGYISANHTVTPWGSVLSAMLSAPTPNPSASHEEAVFLLAELLRLDLITSDVMFPSYDGAPMRGSETDKRNTLLLSRIACLGKLRHRPIGFTGPLSRHLLGYNSIVGVVRGSQRDLLEMSLATLMLEGDVNRDRKDLSDLGLALPFLLPSDCCLGIAMKHYLDELPAAGEPTSAETKEEVYAKVDRDRSFPHTEDFRGDLQRAFALWDAVFEGMKVGVKEGLMRDLKKWEMVNEWVQARR